MRTLIREAWRDAIGIVPSQGHTGHCSSRRIPTHLYGRFAVLDGHTNPDANWGVPTSATHALLAAP